MEKRECLEQLKGLLENSKDMSQEEGDVWAKDVEALQMAIKSVAGVDMARWNAKIFETGIKGNASPLKTVDMMVDCTVEIMKKIMAMTDSFGQFSGLCLVATLRRMESLVLDALATEVVRLEHFKQKEAFTKNIRKRTVKSYNQAVKDDCIKAVLLDGESQTAVGERFGIPQNTISAWVKAAKKKQQEFLDYPEPEQIPVKEPAPEPAAAEEPGPRQESFRTSLVDLKALEEAADGLLTFVDVFEDVGFLTPDEGRKLIELADQAHHYAAGIRWALERI